MQEQEQEKWLNTLLKGDEVDEFLAVQAHHGIRTNADVVRFLIRQESRRIGKQSGALPDPAMKRESVAVGEEFAS